MKLYDDDLVAKNASLLKPVKELEAAFTAQVTLMRAMKRSRESK
jgi:hypothetical protein